MTGACWGLLKSVEPWGARSLPVSTEPGPSSGAPWPSITVMPFTAATGTGVDRQPRTVVRAQDWSGESGTSTNPFRPSSFISLPEYGVHWGFDCSCASETASFCCVVPLGAYTVADTTSSELG